MHTRWSFDAYVQDVRVSPDEAYAFARGDSVRLPPLDAEGNGTREVRLARPLDFVAITDHAEYLAEMAVCLDPTAPGYDAEPCVAIRAGSVSATYGWGGNLTETPPTRFDSICEGSDCTGLARDGWRRRVEQAEAWNDATEACEFTALVAYEYSCSPEVSNAHRNVIFRNATVPDLPTTCFEEGTDWGLWRALERDCLNGEFEDGVCDVLAIPHNSNWSNGNMFFPDYPFAASPEETAELARFRSEMEPLVEIYQHKGDSECSMGFASPLGEPDELCNFEKLRPSGFADCGDGTGSGAMAGLGCKSRLDFVRGALAEGLLEEERIGVNPYRLGIIASTDTHNGIPGYASEQAFEGHTGREESTPQTRLSSGNLIPGGVLMSGGGLAGVWATENSREAIFNAMRRRETFGTSGPRIVPRFYGGQLDPGLCSAADMLDQADASGVPMGGELTGSAADTLPVGGSRSLSGRILREGLFAPDFNGELLLSVRASADTSGYVYYRQVGDSLVERHVPYHLAGPEIFRGRVPVGDGRFETPAFFIPGLPDSALGPFGRIRAFAVSGYEQAVGTLDSLAVEPGILPVDDTPPDVALSLAGGAAHGSPGMELLLRTSAPSGINFVGTHPHNSIFLEYVEAGQVENWTQRFEYDLGSASEGEVRGTLPAGLPYGPNTLVASVADNLGNVGRDTLRVHVFEEGRADLTAVQPFPNPFDRRCAISFELTEAAEVECVIYTISGRRIRRLEMECPEPRRYAFDWNGRDESGDEVGNGTYLYRLVASFGEESLRRRECSGAVVRIRD